MARVSPTLEGFGEAFRRPSITFAEIAWRWTAGAVVWALGFFACIEYLDTLQVNKGDAALLLTKQPVLVARAIAHIFRGSFARAGLAALVAAIALSFIWMVAASVGRAATVRALLDYFYRDRQGGLSTGTPDTKKSRPFLAIFCLNFFRVAVTVAAILAFAGSAILVNLASSAAKPQPGLSFMLFLPLAGLICGAWFALNWLLSLAALFAVRDGENALDAIVAAVDLLRRRTAAIFAVGTWTGVVHLTAFSVASTAATFVFAFMQIAPARLVIAGIILVTLPYFAVVDWIYIARLAGYAFVAEMPDVPAEAAPVPAPPPQSSPQIRPQSSIDRNEPILSDVPNRPGYMAWDRGFDPALIQP